MTSDYQLKAAKVEREADSKSRGLFKSNTKSAQLYEEAGELYKKGGDGMYSSFYELI